MKCWNVQSRRFEYGQYIAADEAEAAKIACFEHGVEALDEGTEIEELWDWAIDQDRREELAELHQKMMA